MRNLGSRSTLLIALSAIAAWSCSSESGGTGQGAAGGSTSAATANTAGVGADSSNGSTRTGDAGGNGSSGTRTSTGANSAAGTGSTATGTGGASSMNGTSVVGMGGAAVSTGTVNACATVSGESKSSAAPPVIEFVLDNTNSMSDDTQASTNGLTKWEALQAAFTTAIPKLAADHPDFAVGLTYFHYRRSTGIGCTDATQAVAIAPLTGAQSTALVANVNAQGQIQMTPTQDIWQFGVDHVTAWGTTDPVYATANRYVVVLTDGVPTVAGGCTETDGCAQGISAAQYDAFIAAVGATKTSTNVTTFMIAVPGAESLDQVTCNTGLMYTPIAKMQEVAIAGGTTLIDLTTSATTDFATALADAITQQIGGSVQTKVSCDYPVPAPPTGQFIDTDAVEVWYYANGGATCAVNAECASGLCSPTNAANPGHCYVRLPRSAGCANGAGWDYTDATLTDIQLCTSACDTAKDDANAKIEILIGCFGVG